MWERTARICGSCSWAGILLVQLVEHTLAPHFHFGEEPHHEAMLDAARVHHGGRRPRIHTFFDGISIASGFVIDLKLGIVPIFIAIIIHKIPEGSTGRIRSDVQARPRDAGVTAARRATFLIGIATILGVATVTFVQRLAPYTFRSRWGSRSTSPLPTSFPR